MFRIALAGVTSVLFTAASAFAWQPPDAASQGWVPAGSLPQMEQIAAAPLLISGYGFFLVLMVFYVWTVWYRIGKVEQDIQALKSRRLGL